MFRDAWDERPSALHVIADVVVFVLLITALLALTVVLWGAGQ